MEDEDYRIMVLNDTTMKVFRDGRIHTYDRCRKKWVDRKFRLNHNDYYMIVVARKYYFVHNVIAMCYLGERPNGHQIDHINNIRNDNRLENLQYITPQENIRKQLYHKKGELIKGYTKTKYGKFRASIRHYYKYIYLGTYDTEAEARQSYVDAKLKYHNVEIENKQ